MIVHRVMVLTFAISSLACRGKPSSSKEDTEPSLPAVAPPTTSSGSEAPATSEDSLPGARPVDVTIRADGGDTQPTCTKDQVRQARSQAQAAFERGEFAAARDRLNQLVSNCYLGPDEAGDKPNLDFFWVYSDMSFAAYKVGDFVECLQILGPLTTPHPPWSIYSFELEETKVGKAIRYNEDLCSKAYEAQQRDFRSDRCSIVENSDLAIEVPREAVPQDIEVVCLTLKGGADYQEFERAIDEDENEPAKLCPSVVMVSRKRGKTTEVQLRASEGPLADTSNCCNLEELSIAVRDGKQLVRVTGGGRNCFGGTADVTLDAVYNWQGERLGLIRDSSVVNH